MTIFYLLPFLQVEVATVHVSVTAQAELPHWQEAVAAAPSVHAKIFKVFNHSIIDLTIGLNICALPGFRQIVFGMPLICHLYHM